MMHIWCISVSCLSHCQLPIVSSLNCPSAMSCISDKELGNSAACLWRTGSSQREASHSLLLPLPLTLPHSVPTLCSIQSWLNSLSFFLPFFCSFSCCLLLLLIFPLPSGILILISHFNSLPFPLPVYHFFIFSLFSALHGRYDLHTPQAETQLQCLWDWGFG